MKKPISFLLILLILLPAACGCAGSDRGFSEGPFSLDAGNIRMVTVSWTAGGCLISFAEGGTITADETADAPAPALRWKNEDGVLTIKFEGFRLFNKTSDTPKNLLLTLPLDSGGRSVIVATETASCTVEGCGASLPLFVWSTTAGDLRLSDLTLEEGTFAAGSGRITLSGLSADEITAVSSSGAVSFLDPKRIDKLSVSTASGPVSFAVSDSVGVSVSCYLGTGSVTTDEEAGFTFDGTRVDRYAEGPFCRGEILTASGDVRFERLKEVASE